MLERSCLQQLDFPPLAEYCALDVGYQTASTATLYCVVHCCVSSFA